MHLFYSTKLKQSNKFLHIAVYR